MSLNLDIGAGLPIDYDPGDWIRIDPYAEGADIKAFADKLPYENNLVDSIWSSHMLEHVGKFEVVNVLKEWWRILSREVKVGISLGLIMGLIAFAIAAISLKEFTVAITVGISLCTVVSVGNIVGLAIPLFFRFIKLDPAFVSAPLIATLLDATGLVIYFEIASRILTPTTQ